MNIKVLVKYKAAEKFTKDAVNEYSKRLSKYCRISMKECKSDTQLLKEISERTYLININPEGCSISSEDLANKFSELGISGQSDLTFIVSDEKLSDEILAKINFNLAISKFNIAPSILIVVLYEQIYRGFRINKGEPYHK